MDPKTYKVIITITPEHWEQAQKESALYPAQLPAYCVLAVAAREVWKSTDIRVGLLDICIGKQFKPEEIWTLDLRGQQLVTLFDTNWYDPNFKFDDSRFFSVALTRRK